MIRFKKYYFSLELVTFVSNANLRWKVKQKTRKKEKKVTRVENGTEARDQLKRDELKKGVAMQPEKVLVFQLGDIPTRWLFWICIAL